MSKETKLYQFYYTLIHNKDIKIVWGVKWCKLPKRTKIYKILINKLDSGQINTLGHEQIEN